MCLSLQLNNCNASVQNTTPGNKLTEIIYDFTDEMIEQVYNILKSFKNSFTNTPSGRSSNSITGTDFMRILNELFWWYLSNVGLIDRVQFLFCLKHSRRLQQSTVTWQILILIIIIIITMTMFMVLSSWHHVSPPIGCYHSQTPSPFIIITQLVSWYSFYRLTEDGRLSRPRHCSKGAQHVTKAVYQ